jgi:hypothetical protein
MVNDMLYKTLESEQKYRNILTLVKSGKNRKEICSKLKINEQTYYKYMQTAEGAGHLKKSNYIVLPSFDVYVKENNFHKEIDKILKDSITNEVDLFSKPVGLDEKTHGKEIRVII